MESPQNHIFEFGGFTLDTRKRLLYESSGETVPLMPKVFDTLIFLVENSGKVVSKDDLLAAIWVDTIVEENNLTQNISSLRRVFREKPGEHRFISTVPGRGYKFVAEVSQPASGRFDPAGQVVPLSTAEDSETETENIHTALEAEKPSRPAGRKMVYAAFAVIGFAVILAVYIASSRSDGTADRIQSVAVLPFTNPGQLPDTEYLSDGIAENVINSLSRLTNLKVMSRNSTFRFREDQANIRSIGSQLGVAALVTGDIRQVGDNFIINVRLIDARDETQIWGNQYVKSSTDVIAAQNEIAQAVAQNLSVKLNESDNQVLGKHATQNAAAWQLYQRGRFHVYKLTPPELQKGIVYLQRAIEVDPNYALAYAGISDVYRSLALSTESSPIDSLAKSKAASNRAIELDDTLSEGHAGLGMTVFWGEWNWEASETHYQRALGLNPNNAMAHLFYAHLLSNLGRHAESATEMKLARELDPLFPFGNALEGQFLLHAGRTNEALAQLRETVDLAPGFWMPHLFASSAYIEKGMFDEAISSARRATELSPVQTVSIAYESYALAKSGRRTEAQVNLNKLLKLSNDRSVPATHIATIYNGLGDHKKALEWLEKGFEQRDPKMAFLKVEPKWNNLRSEPRFIDLMRRMNFN